MARENATARDPRDPPALPLPREGTRDGRLHACGEDDRVDNTG